MINTFWDICYKYADKHVASNMSDWKRNFVFFQDTLKTEYSVGTHILVRIILREGSIHSAQHPWLSQGALLISAAFKFVT
jgi:hypothetical protein